MNFLNQTFKRRRVLKILGVSAVGAITGGALINSFKHKVHKVHWQGISLGSPAEITIYHHEKDKAESIIEKSVKRINYLENLFSLYKKDSQLSILNEEGTLESPASEMLNLMYLSKKYTTKSLPDIGRKFSGRDHTTVIHSVKTIEKLLQKDNSLFQSVDLIKKQFLMVG